MTTSVIQYNGKPTPDGLVQIYAHRGGRGLAPENTLLAYTSALRQGVDYVDMDIHISKDGELVVYHDFELFPSIVQNDKNNWIPRQPQYLIHDLNLKELGQYHIGGLQPNTEYASYFPFQQSQGLTSLLTSKKIPTLEEVISFIKKYDPKGKVGFVIEIKQENKNREYSASPEEYARKLARILKKENITDRTEVQAFNWECLSLLKKEFDHPNDVKTAYLSPEEEAKNYPNQSYPSRIKELGGDCWHPYEGSIVKQDIIEAHNNGLKIVAWGYPEKEKTDFNFERIRDLIKWGIDGLLTDRPDELRGILSLSQNLPQGFDID